MCRGTQGEDGFLNRHVESVGGAHAAGKNGCELSRVLRFFTMLRRFGFSTFCFSDVVGAISVWSAPTSIGAMYGARHQARSAFAAREAGRTLGRARVSRARRVQHRRFGVYWHGLCFCLSRGLVYAGSTPRAPNVEPPTHVFTRHGFIDHGIARGCRRVRRSWRQNRADGMSRHNGTPGLRFHSVLCAVIRSRRRTA